MLLSPTIPLRLLFAASLAVSAIAPVLAAESVPRDHQLDLRDCAWRVQVGERTLWVQGDERDDRTFGELPARAGRIADGEIYWAKSYRTITGYAEKGDSFTVEFSGGTITSLPEADRVWLHHFQGSDGSDRWFRSNTSSWRPAPGSPLVKRSEAIAQIDRWEGGSDNGSSSTTYQKTTVVVLDNHGSIVVGGNHGNGHGHTPNKITTGGAAYPTGPGSEKIPVAGAASDANGNPLTPINSHTTPFDPKPGQPATASSSLIPPTGPSLILTEPQPATEPLRPRALK